MAIYPWHSTNIKNVDVLTASNFQAGMALWTDANGRAIKADSQQQVFTSVTEKYARFLGFAASDHDLNNTLILPDVVGSNYVDANNAFVINTNTEYSVPKRGLLDLQDSSVSKFYNPSESYTIAKRGIGVYNTPGDIFITDQFLPVLHGDYGVDGTSIQTISAGDLLTFGGGANAGKLVKVNINSFGPDILVVGKVEKYNPATGLLYFSQTSYNLSFGSAAANLIALDAGSTVSYPGSGTVWYDLSGNARNFTLINGPAYSALNSGLISFDGTNDYALTNYTIASNSITVLVWYNSRSFSTSISSQGLISNYNTPGFDIRKFGAALQLYIDINASFVARNITSNVIDNTWYNIAFTYDGTNLITYTNGSSVSSLVSAGTRANGSGIVIGTSATDYARTLSCFVSEVRILSRAITATEVSAYYNSTKSRYGL